ncbi:MAG: DUF4346 domain-containing protein [Synechococcales bacterium]|nr:DUF4346 domain-containing protein [Synechococcales bacterium]
MSHPRFDIDHHLSQRPLDLDPGGYFIISLDRDNGLICAQHYSNVIDERGVACDPVTGKPIPARGGARRLPTAVFTGRTAKELCVAIFETAQPCPVTQYNHAAYLGREFQRAELALISGQDYLQD